MGRLLFPWCAGAAFPTLAIMNTPPPTVPAPTPPPAPTVRRFARSLMLLGLAGTGGVAVGLGVQALNGPVLERLAQVPAQAAITRCNTLAQPQLLSSRGEKAG